MIGDLRKAQKGELVFDAEKYVNKIPTKKGTTRNGVFTVASTPLKKVSLSIIFGVPATWVSIQNSTLSNNLYFEVNGVRFELPSVDLVLLKSKELLGEPVEARFGKDFPIR